MSESKEIKYRNDTGGLLTIPLPAPDSPLEGAVKSWVHVEDGKTFAVECIDGEPVNSSLRVLHRAKEFGIRPASEDAPKRTKSKRSRKIK
jgi:hypothetical protein